MWPVMSDKRFQVLTVKEAAEFLGVTRAKVSRMMKDKELAYTIDPLDKRIRLISVEDLQALLNRSRKAA
jgi:excisionase family DNA binding protein